MNSNTRPLRQLSTLDRWLAEADRAMRTVLAPRKRLIGQVRAMRIRGWNSASRIGAMWLA